jgi:hypothetical protein
VTSLNDRKYVSPALSGCHSTCNLASTILRPELSFKGLKVNFLGIFLNYSLSLYEFSLFALGTFDLVRENIIFIAVFIIATIIFFIRRRKVHEFIDIILFLAILSASRLVVIVDHEDSLLFVVPFGL